MENVVVENVQTYTCVTSPLYIPYNMVHLDVIHIGIVDVISVEPHGQCILNVEEIS